MRAASVCGRQAVDITLLGVIAVRMMPAAIGPSP